MSKTWPRPHADLVTKLGLEQRNRKGNQVFQATAILPKGRSQVTVPFKSCWSMLTPTPATRRPHAQGKRAASFHVTEASITDPHLLSSPWGPLCPHFTQLLVISPKHSALSWLCAFVQLSLLSVNAYTYIPKKLPFIVRRVAWDRG